MSRAKGAGVTVSEHAVVRVAGWPLESAAGFASPQLRTEAASFLRHSRRLHARAASLTDSLAAAVPMVGGSTRRWLLAARRALHGGRTVPVPPADALRAPGLAHLVADAVALSDELEAMREDRDRLLREHDRLQARQLEQLRIGAADERFVKALAVDKPAVADQWRRTLVRPWRDRARVRRLHATVFRHLMGAAGRATPRQAWAGVVPVMPTDGPGLRVMPGPRRFRFTPSLEPFEQVVERWSHRRAGTASWPLRRSPLIIEEPGAWVHPRPGDDSGSWHRTASSAARQAVFTFWADGEARPPAALLEFADLANGASARERIATVIAELVSAGVLVNGAVMPTAAAECWDALDGTSALLPEPERATWVTTVGTVRLRCAELDRGFDAAGIDEVVATRTAIVAAIGTLWSEAGLEGSPPEPLVHVDMVGPWRAEWGADARTQRARDVADVLSRTAAADGAAEQFRRAIVAGLPARARRPGVPFLEVCFAMPAPPPGRAATLREAFIRRGCDPDSFEAHWERELVGRHDEPQYELPMPAAGSSARRAGPAGSMLFTLGDPPWAKWGRPQVGLFSARHLSLLEPETGPAPTHEHLHVLERLRGVQLWGSDPVSRSTAMRPVATARITPDGGPDDSLVGATMEIDDDDAIWLRCGPHGERRRPLYDAPAAIGVDDRASRLLLAAAMSHGWELPAWGVPILPAELHEWHHLPRLSLPGGLVVSAERWLVADDVARRLARLDPADRYLEWCGEVEHRGLPSLTLVRRGLDPSAPEMLFPVDSPLAVAAVFEPLVDLGGPLVLTEVAPEACLSVHEEQSTLHYVAELAVTWVSNQP